MAPPSNGSLPCPLTCSEQGSCVWDAAFHQASCVCNSWLTGANDIYDLSGIDCQLDLRITFPFWSLSLLVYVFLIANTLRTLWQIVPIHGFDAAEVAPNTQSKRPNPKLLSPTSAPAQRGSPSLPPSNTVVFIPLGGAIDHEDAEANPQHAAAAAAAATHHPLLSSPVSRPGTNPPSPIKPQNTGIGRSARVAPMPTTRDPATSPHPIDSSWIAPVRPSSRSFFQRLRRFFSHPSIQFCTGALLCAVCWVMFFLRKLILRGVNVVGVDPFDSCLVIMALFIYWASVHGMQFRQMVLALSLYQLETAGSRSRVATLRKWSPRLIVFSFCVACTSLVWILLLLIVPGHSLAFARGFFISLTFSVTAQALMVTNYFYSASVLRKVNEKERKEMTDKAQKSDVTGLAAAGSSSPSPTSSSSLSSGALDRLLERELVVSQLLLLARSARVGTTIGFILAILPLSSDDLLAYGTIFIAIPATLQGILLNVRSRALRANR